LKDIAAEFIVEEIPYALIVLAYLILVRELVRLS
jgi:hypothetical protein